MVIESYDEITGHQRSPDIQHLENDHFSESENLDDDEFHSGQENDEEEDDDEDLFDESMERDYIPQPHLDTYDPELLDDENEYLPISHRGRRRAEREIAEREKQNRLLSTFSERHPEASRYYSGLEDLLAEDTDEDEEIRNQRRHRREQLHRDTSSMVRPLPRESDEAREELPHCEPQIGWTPRVEALIKLLIQGFIWNYRKVPSSQENTNSQQIGLYIDKITEVVKEEGTSLYVQWQHLAAYSIKLCDWLLLHPTPVLKVFDDVFTEICKSLFPTLYSSTLAVRLRGFLGLEQLRNIRTDCLNQLVAVEGVCIRRTNVFPQLKLYYLECLRCGCDMNGPYEKQVEAKTQIKRKCQDCQGNGPFVISKEKTLYKNFQKLVIQEHPSGVKPGHVPRQRQVVVIGDLVDAVRPGDEIIVTGIYQTIPNLDLNAKTGFPIFATQILANNVERKGDIQMQELTEENITFFKKLAQQPNIRNRILDSIAPSIFGHRHVKTALAYAMFGGVRKVTTGNMALRGDINVLILGDPGTAKSQFLKYVDKAFDRTVYTTGKGASAVGLTAAVKRDVMSGEWMLEGGALVLADEGICLIDEFDKMSDRDRVSIHEAMEQQSISISKAGIVASLRARCSIIAAANPIFGRYNSSLTFTDNVDLSDPMLSRFDVLAVLKDEQNPVQDEYLADYVTNSHMQSHPDRETVCGVMYPRESNLSNDASQNPLDDLEQYCMGSGILSHEILKKYIMYARRHCYPEMRNADEQSLVEFYSSIRQAACHGGGIPMTVRHMESMIRMAQANAKMRLSRFVDKVDFHHAIGSMLESFIQSQKHAIAALLNRKFGRFRALASTPQGFLEKFIIDILGQKDRESYRHSKLLERRIGESNNDIDSTMDEHQSQSMNEIFCVASSEVKWSEIVTLAKVLYDIPENALTQFSKSARFSEKFIMKKVDRDWFVGATHNVYETLSQTSQESME